MNILWDFDGTLLDTYPAYSDILHEVLEEKVSREEIFAHLKISFTHTVRHYGLEEHQVKQIIVNEQKLHPSKTGPFPFVENILKLADVNVIMTHKPRKEVIPLLEYYGWMPYFKEIVAGGDGYPSKPNPESYIYLHEKYKLDLAIGDREIDIIPAKIIGIRTCLFQNDTPGADIYVSNYEDLFNHLSVGGRT
ncbi:HAD-IA family hydrolase [Paenibacillus sp. UNC451MF]|uniref:HAD-IA family hydrolase n=1 Tax=Paenibacillus sp. UNC451MF TaxID=1449063 RepID=UPI0004913A05|nr:HAD-IA family hydrolase [Paenibacillus sp. UNC451MF]